MKTIATVFVTVFGLVLMIGIFWMSAHNSEVRIRNAVTAQQKANEAIFDNVWKTIRQQAEVTDAYKDGFREVWKEIVSGQNDSQRKATFLAWANHVNPQFDAGVYKQLMATIEGQRREFLTGQKMLIDRKREHDNVLVSFPSSLFVGGRGEIEIVIVTSTKTQEAFGAGKDDDVSVFSKKK